MQPITIYEADDGIVYFVDSQTLNWDWDNGNGNTGTEIIPFAEAEDYFLGNGREDIAELIHNRETYCYGHYGGF